MCCAVLKQKGHTHLSYGQNFKKYVELYSKLTLKYMYLSHIQYIYSYMYAQLFYFFYYFLNGKWTAFILCFVLLTTPSASHYKSALTPPHTDSYTILVAETTMLITSGYHLHIPVHLHTNGAAGSNLGISVLSMDTSTGRLQG